MNRTQRNILSSVLCMLLILACTPCRSLATIVSQTDPISILQMNHQIDNKPLWGHTPKLNSGHSIATSPNTQDSSNHGFMNQVTDSSNPAPLDQVLADHSNFKYTTQKSSVWLITRTPAIRGNKSIWLPMDARWLSCCGEGTVLTSVDSNYQTLVNATQHQKQRTASLVAIAKTGTALPLSFEVSRRVRAKSVPEPSSMTLIGFASLLLLRRKKHSRKY